MSNIAEGLERFRPGEFHQYLSVVKGSCGEVRSQLYVALDARYITQSGFESLMSRLLKWEIYWVVCDVLWNAGENSSETNVDNNETTQHSLLSTFYFSVLTV